MRRLLTHNTSKSIFGTSGAQGNGEKIMKKSEYDKLVKRYAELSEVIRYIDFYNTPYHFLAEKTFQLLILLLDIAAVQLDKEYKEGE